MKVLIVLALAAVANSQYIHSGVPLNYNYGYSALAPAVHYAAPVVAPAVTKTQYHAQDELGQASYGHAEPGQSHAAFRDASGNVRGSYAYIDPNGKEVRVNYLAGHNGFQVESNALPQAPVHFVAQQAPVQDTPEVAAAKVAHFAAVAEAQARAGRKKRGVVAAPLGLGYGYSSVVSHGLNHVAYSASPVVSNIGYSAYAAPAIAHTYAAAPAIAHTYAAAPAIAHTYAAAPAIAHTYAAAPAIAHTYAAAPAIAHTYAAAPVAAVAAQPLREATLTKVVNTPGHAVSYRVD